MATRRVRFDFKCDDGKKVLQFHHDIPASLVRADAVHSNLFTQVLQSIDQSHEAKCRAGPRPQCDNCGKPTAKTLMTFISWLYIVFNPFVNVWVTPACQSAACEVALRQQLQTSMQIIAESPEGRSMHGT